MSGKWIFVGILVIGLVVWLQPAAAPGRAQEATPENDANCVSCHEHQYYFYDRGKWFCLCEAPMHCVYCHSGRTDTPLKELAHEGLVLYPTREHAERCQACHSEDYLERVVTFAAVAGISATPQAIITATPVEAAAMPPEGQPAAARLRLNQLETWRLVGLGLIALALVGVSFAGFRCWKADCLAKFHA
jgi:hypothetical protein